MKPRLRDADLEPLVADGRLLRVQVEGWESPAYVHGQQQGALRKALRGSLVANHTTVLSPFDPLVWDRERALACFGFDYRIECYTPAEKRVYGYFVLPLLHNGELIGRLDAKAHREESVFEIRKLFLQPGVVADDALIEALGTALWRCARWHEALRVRLSHMAPAALAPRLRRVLRRYERETP
jgi:hypothetical protein